MNMSRILTFGLLLVASLSARAATLTVDVNTLLTGGPGVPGSQSVAKLTIKDTAANTVEVKIENLWSNVVFGNGSFLTRLFLETTLATAIPNGMHVSGNPIDGWGNSGKNAGFSFDKRVEFETANNANRFRSGEESVFTLTATGLDATDFTRAMVHIQGIAQNGESAKYTGEAVPEPGTMIALGMGVAAAVRRRKKA